MKSNRCSSFTHIQAHISQLAGIADVGANFVDFKVPNSEHPGVCDFYFKGAQPTCRSMSCVMSGLHKHAVVNITRTEYLCLRCPKSGMGVGYSVQIYHACGCNTAPLDGLHLSYAARDTLRGILSNMHVAVTLLGGTCEEVHPTEAGYKLPKHDPKHWHT